MGARIVLIGAGSVIFARTLVHDIVREPSLQAAEIVLHDIDTERLRVAESAIRADVAAAGARVAVRSDPSQQSALQGATAVICMVQIGGHPATQIDLELPARAGLRQTIGDTLGVGGIFRALRTFPFLDDLVENMRAVCPGAVLLNYTNPMAMIVQYLAERAPDVRVIGLCHSVQGTVARLAGLCGVPLSEVVFTAAGVNHQAWILRLERDGVDLYPRLDEAIGGDPELARTVRVEVYRRFGFYPTESSEHLAEYVPWFLHHEGERRRFRIEESEYLRRSTVNLQRFDELRARVDADRALDAPSNPGHEYAPRMLAAMSGGAPVVVYGNVPNRGLIANLPAQACVEVPCLVDATGHQPVMIGSLPAQCAALNRTCVNVCDLVVRAAIDGRRDHVLHAALLDPNTAASLRIDQIADVVERMLAAHAGSLPPSLS